MLTPRLLKKNPLTFKRKVVNTGGWDDYGNPISATEDVDVEATGSLQPYQKGKTRQDLPEGIKANHVKLYYTVTELYMYDDITNQEADTTTIDGVEFVVYDIEDWFTPAYNTKNYKVYLVRKDKL